MFFSLVDKRSISTVLRRSASKKGLLRLVEQSNRWAPNARTTPEARIRCTQLIQESSNLKFFKGTDNKLRNSPGPGTTEKPTQNNHQTLNNEQNRSE